MFADGFEDCSMMDADGDRLRDCQEIFGNVSDPALVDTDGDGLSDGDEVLGTTDGLDLRSLGAKPRRRTILVEIDWVDDAFQCQEGAHSHRPTASVVAKAQQVFSAAKLPNPDGSTGIDFIVDYGQGGPFNGGGLITTLPNGMVDQLGPQYYATRTANFAPNRHKRFHYQLWAHRYETTSNGSSGWAEVGGDDGIVSLHCSRVESSQVIALVHEVGHNFGLEHGGDSACNNKPNYNSVMNYRYEFTGLDTDCDALPDDLSKVDYSYGTNVSIDENHVNEFLGVCASNDVNAKPVDWDGDHMPFADISCNLNAYDYELTHCGGTLTTLTDHPDWQSLDLAVIALSSGGAAPQATPLEQCPSPPGAL